LVSEPLLTPSWQQRWIRWEPHGGSHDQHCLDNFTAPPSSKLLGWHLLDARPGEGWIRIGFDGRKDFCNPAGFIQGGILAAMLDDTMGPAVFVTTEG